MPALPARLSPAIALLALTACGSDNRATYSRDIEPLLHRYCLDCHSFEAGQVAAGGFSVEGYETVFAGGNHGPVLDIANPQASKLRKILSGELRLYENDVDHYIPTTAAQRRMIDAWVDQGVLGD